MKSLEGALPVVGRPLCGPLVMKPLMQGAPMCPVCPSSVVGEEIPGVGISMPCLGRLMKSLEGALPKMGRPVCGPLVMKSLLQGTSVV